METISSYKTNIMINIKTKEDDNYYYFYIFINDKELRHFKGKDYYKTKDKANEYLRNVYNIVVI